MPLLKWITWIRAPTSTFFRDTAKTAAATTTAARMAGKSRLEARPDSGSGVCALSYPHCHRPPAVFEDGTAYVLGGSLTPSSTSLRGRSSALLCLQCNGLHPRLPRMRVRAANPTGGRLCSCATTLLCTARSRSATPRVASTYQCKVATRTVLQ